MDRVIVYPAPTPKQIIFVSSILIFGIWMYALIHDLNLANERSKRYENLLTVEQNKNHDLRCKLRRYE